MKILYLQLPSKLQSYPLAFVMLSKHVMPETTKAIGHKCVQTIRQFYIQINFGCLRIATLSLL
jgi:hypothetical protein